jgi:opacity protein-like surface antigen
MKKLFLAATILLASISVAEAQTGFGVRGGGSYSNLSGDLKNESRYENKLGFHAGVFLNFPISDQFFSIQPELIYSQKGFKNSEEEFSFLGQNYKRTGKVNYNYLDLPVLARISAGPVYFEGGPQASYLLNVNNETKEFMNGNLQSSTTTERDKEGMKEFELGYVAGVGFATNSGISLGLRYNGSLNDFLKDNSSDYFNGDLGSAKHSVVMLTIGFKLSDR